MFKEIDKGNPKKFYCFRENRISKGRTILFPFRASFNQLDFRGDSVFETEFQEENRPYPVGGSSR
jgi:hypothetical protein